MNKLDIIKMFDNAENFEISDNVYTNCINLLECLCNKPDCIKPTSRNSIKIVYKSGFEKENEFGIDIYETNIYLSKIKNNDYSNAIFKTYNINNIEGVIKEYENFIKFGFTNNNSETIYNRYYY